VKTGVKPAKLALELLYFSGGRAVLQGRVKEHHQPCALAPVAGQSRFPEMLKNRDTLKPFALNLYAPDFDGYSFSAARNQSIGNGTDKKCANLLRSKLHYDRPELKPILFT